MGGEAALSVEARFLEPDLPIELDDAYAQTFDRLRRLFRARGCTPEEAADLAQEAAVRAFLHIRRWGGATGGLDPLLNRISRNLLIDRYRRVSPHLVPLDSASDLYDPEQDLTEEVARRQRRRAVHHAIRELPSRHQAAITYSLSGMSPEEVGKELGIGRNAADALLHRARRSLKEHLAPVREGMWGIAIAVHIRWDRLTRRASLGGAQVDSSAALVSSVAAGIATAAIVLAMGVTGGGNGSGGPIGGSIGGSERPALGRVAETRGVDGAAATTPGSGSGEIVGDPTGGSSSARSFKFGPTTTTSHGKDGLSNDISVPDPGNENGPPLLQISQWIWSDENAAPPTDDQRDLLTRTVCSLGNWACLIGS